MRVRLSFSMLIFALGCQSTQEKNALFLKDRVEKLEHLSSWKPLRCEIKSKLAASQAVKYRTAFAEEIQLLDNWDVSYEWSARNSRCDLHVKPLTPMTANQKVFVEEALCTLMQVFWVHSPFDGLKVLPTDLVDQENAVFLKQKADSDIGIYLDKKEMRLETKTAKKGTFFAKYKQEGGVWLPEELRHQTTGFTFVMRDFEWSGEPRTPPKSFWIYIGEQHATPTAHSGGQIVDCKTL